MKTRLSTLRCLSFAAVSAVSLSFAFDAQAKTVTLIFMPMMITPTPCTVNAPGYYQPGAELTGTDGTGFIITVNAYSTYRDNLAIGSGAPTNGGGRREQSPGDAARRTVEISRATSFR